MEKRTLVFFVLFVLGILSPVILWQLHEHAPNLFNLSALDSRAP